MIRSASGMAFLSRLLTLTAGGRPNGNTHGDLGAAAGLALELELASHLVDAFANAPEPEPAGGRIVVDRRESAPVIPHRQVHHLVAEAQLDVDAPGLRVLDRIGERLEADAQEMVLLRGVQALRVPQHVYRRLEGRALRHLLRQVA